MKTYLYSYLHRGARYGFEIVADDIHEADDRLRSIKFGEVQYDGILEATIPAGVGSWLPRLVVAIGNAFRRDGGV